MAGGRKISTQRALATVEEAYRLPDTDSEWLERLLAVAAPDLDRGMGLYAATGQIVDGHLVPAPPLAAYRLAPATAQHALALHARLPCPVLDAFVPHASVIGGLDEAWPCRLAAAELYRRGMAQTGVRDAFVAYANDGEGGCVQIIAPSQHALCTHPRVRAIWGRVMVHVAAALRLRRRVRAGQQADAMLGPDGATGELPASLRARVISASERIRTARAGSSGRALELWQGLVLGRFSLVDHWDAGGRRYVLVYRNRPATPNPRALGPTESAIVELVGRGASRKDAAYALGLSMDAIAKGLASGLAKLGLERRDRLAALVTGHTEVLDVTVGEARLDVMIATPSMAPLPGLTPSERAIVAAIVSGASNAQIAAERRTAQRTVANQLQRIFAKLGARSRAELRQLALQRPTDLNHTSADGAESPALSTDGPPP